MRLYNIVRPAVFWHFYILRPTTNNFIHTTTYQNLSTGFIFYPPTTQHTNTYKTHNNKTRTSKQTPLYR